MGAMRGRFYDFDAVGFDDEIKPLEIRVPIMNDIAAGRLVIRKFHGQVSGLLPHPGGVRVWHTAGDMDAARAEVNKEQHVKGDQPGFGPDLFGKKVGRPGHVQVGLDEGFPFFSILNGQAVSDQNGSFGFRKPDAFADFGAQDFDFLTQIGVFKGVLHPPGQDRDVYL
jgi:hypothetical protein